MYRPCKKPHPGRRLKHFRVQGFFDPDEMRFKVFGACGTDGKTLERRSSLNDLDKVFPRDPEAP